MKKWLSIILVVALLMGGCTKPETDTQPGTTAPSTQPDVPSTEPTVPSESSPTEPSTEPVKPAPRPDFGLYLEGSPIEVSTGGAVKQFALEQFNPYAILPVGDGLLLFSGEEDTLLTFYRENQPNVSLEVPGSCLFPDDLIFRVLADGFAFYDSNEGRVEYYDFDFNLQDALDLPDAIFGSPAITADKSRVYYFMESGLYYTDVASGISKLLMECTFEQCFLEGLLFQDSVIECHVISGDELEVLYVYAQTGEILSSSTLLPDVSTDEQWYFARYSDSIYDQLLFGKRDGVIQALSPEYGYEDVTALPKLRSAMLYLEAQSGCVLDLYDLTDGKRSASVVLPGLSMPWNVRESTNPQRIWFLAMDEVTCEQGLYCWEPELSATGDSKNYVGPYYTASKPDTEGLERIRQRLKELESQYGIRLRMYEDAISKTPSDFTFVAEYRVPVYEHYLPMLERALASYPKDFLKKLGKKTSDNEKLTICLVGGAYGDNEAGALSQADGVQYILDGNFYIALVMNEAFEGSFYHEVYHAIDIYILGQISNFDFWDTLNPEGFRYDNDYLANMNRDDYRYLEGENRYFIDMYSMSFAKEDRARVMEYAMQPGNEAFFQSKHMQAKLAMLCKAVREAFGMKKFEGELIWEQYLKD